MTLDNIIEDNPYQDIIMALYPDSPSQTINEPDTLEQISMDSFYSTLNTGQTVLNVETETSKISFTNEILSTEKYTESASIIIRDNITGHAMYIHIDPVSKKLTNKQQLDIKQFPDGILSASIIEGVTTPYDFTQAIHDLRNQRKDIVVFNSIKLPEKERYKLVYDSKTDGFYIHNKEQTHAYKAKGLDLGLDKKTSHILSIIVPQKIDLIHEMHS